MNTGDLRGAQRGDGITGLAKRLMQLDRDPRRLGAILRAAQA